MSVIDAPRPSVEVPVETKKTVFADMYARYSQNIGELTRAINEYLSSATTLIYTPGSGSSESMPAAYIDNIYIDGRGVVTVHVKHAYHLQYRTPIHGTVDQFDLK